MRVSLNDIAEPQNLIGFVILHYDANTEKDRVVDTYSPLELEKAEQDLYALQKANSSGADWFRLCELDLADKLPTQKIEAGFRERMDATFSSANKPENIKGNIRYLSTYITDDVSYIDFHLTINNLPTYSGRYSIIIDSGFVSLGYEYRENIREVIDLGTYNESSKSWALPLHIYKGILSMIQQNQAKIEAEIGLTDLDTARSTINYVLNENK